MNYQTLLDNIAQDFVIDQNDLLNESVKTSKLFVKYITLWSNERLKLEHLENSKKNLEHARRAFYRGEAPDEDYYAAGMIPGQLAKTGTDLSKALMVDPEMVKYEKNMIIQKQKIQVLVAALDEIKSRTYQIKDAIAMKKFESGY